MCLEVLLKMKTFNLNDVIDCFPNLISKNQLAEMKKVDSVYPVKISDYYLNLALKSEAIFKQAFPTKEELLDNLFCEYDPLNENENQKVPGLIHKYTNKAIIITTNCCFMNCRHCTRKRLLNSSHSFEPPQYNKIFEYISQHTEINDILLTGGDALTLCDEKLFSIINSLQQIQHINTIRIGTRAPVTFPQRITESLCKQLGLYKNIWINTHFNHPDEITEESIYACKLIQSKGIPICNQTVILKGINDNYNTLFELFLKLVNIRVVPYYLYQCDNVKGVSHFITSPKFGAEVIKKLRNHLPGMAVPRYIIDTQNNMGKIISEFSNVIKVTENSAELINSEGKICKIQYDINFPKNE